jgi:N-acetylglutamate synthase-like GNAT family acetyltransferase
MIRPADIQEAYMIADIVADAARAYRGAIPSACWHEPYFTPSEVEREIAAGVEFWVYEDNGRLTGVMGLQDKGDVMLIRHAYVRTACQRTGVGGRLLDHLLSRAAAKPVLVGTWAAASWAIRFYEQHGFSLLPKEQGWELLARYWHLTPLHRETSVVLADKRWLVLHGNQ